ncbi:MAG: HAD family phosphatase [Ignavibacteriales bacterium CG_4_9_14_3_um_filter_34_10]|nr:MAG: HAD family phosphatase [Ignavibacteriales bacterium CG_4_9_14_3_um_filter_34_10]
MSSITTVVFDLGNVLIPFDYSIMIKRLNNISPSLGDKYYEKYKSNYHVHKEFEKWQLSNEEFIRINLEWLDTKVSADEFCRLYSDIFTENRQTTSLLPLLKKNHKLFLLSNTNYIHQKYGWEKYDFLKWFDGLILSHEVGATKPEEKIYKAVEKVSFDKSESHLFIDDVKEYVDGAVNIGWNAVQFINHEKLLRDLKSFGVL